MGEENNDKNKKKVTKTSNLPNVAAPSHSHNSSGPSQIPSRQDKPMDIVYYSLRSDTSSLGTTQAEEEIQVIEPDFARPIQFITPTLKQEAIDLKNLTKNLSTTDKLLIDQKAKLTHLRPSNKRRHAIDFGPVLEVDNDDDSFSLERTSGTRQIGINDRHNQNENSEDADISEVDSAL